MRAAALFHDIAKPYTMKEEEERLRFIGHEKEGGLWQGDNGSVGMAGLFREKVSALVRWHMVPLVSTAPKRIPVFILVRQSLVGWTLPPFIYRYKFKQQRLFQMGRESTDCPVVSF